MRVSLFDFDLPPDQVAQKPASPRDSARLMHVSNDLKHYLVRDLPSLLQPGDALVVNDTKVIPCRIVGQRDNVKVEVTLHKSLNSNTWQAFAKPGRKLKPNDVIIFSEGFEAKVVKKLVNGEIILVFNQSEKNLMIKLEHHGLMPLPPYIKRNNVNFTTDRDDYQTLFASNPGAVAAPTAGLHFTPDLETEIEARGIHIVRITLHVGAGTFLPVKVSNTEDHIMHFESATLNENAAATLNAIRANGRQIIALGSTALRTLETACNGTGTIYPFNGETDLFITPGYRFKVVDRIVTNFHLPKSTLFMLVSAFSGLERMQSAYTSAIRSGYRFYSYGDACLLEPNRAKWGNTQN